MPSWLKKEGVQERKVLVTYEATYDIADTEEYIAVQFGDKRADKYSKDIRKQLMDLSIKGTAYSKSGFKYRNYIIYKKLFSPAIIFWIIKENSIHVLRVLRENYNWQRYFRTHRYYEYTYSDCAFV